MSFLFRQALRPATSLAAHSRLGLGLNSNSIRFLSQEIRAKIDETVKSKPLVLFMKGTPDSPQCGFSRAVVQILDLQGVPLEKMQTYDVLVDPELRTSIKEYSEWPTIPQVFVNGEFVGGCDIVLGMHQSGELEELLEKNGVIPKILEEESKQASSSS
ncbi:hypothetical protein AX15_003624 [Amanita polypyramis BW_CC]|nr:hypothetical protein AX15_003624 [Amanita polypyramis BW_CC]